MHTKIWRYIYFKKNTILQNFRNIWLWSSSIIVLNDV